MCVVDACVRVHTCVCVRCLCDVLCDMYVCVCVCVWVVVVAGKRVCVCVCISPLQFPSPWLREGYASR